MKVVRIVEMSNFDFWVISIRGSMQKLWPKHYKERHTQSQPPDDPAIQTSDRPARRIHAGNNRHLSGGSRVLIARARRTVRRKIAGSSGT